MHLGLITEHSDPARGGCERYLAALGERVRAHGHRLTVCARTGPHAVPVRAFPRATRADRYARLFVPRLRAEGVERILTTHPVAGCDFYQPHHGVLAETMPARLRPLPPALRALKLANPVRHLLVARLVARERAALAPPTVLLALSPRVIADADRHYPGARVELLRPGVDLERYRPGAATRPRDGALRLLFVSQNFRLKGLPTLLRALARVARAHLHVVGRERPVPAPRTTFLGTVDDLPALYRSMDLLVHPTWYDTASRVVLEALASGLPAITTRFDGSADLVAEAGGAVLDDPSDDRALADAIERCAATASRERARAVAERFPETAMLDAVVQRWTSAS